MSSENGKREESGWVEEWEGMGRSRISDGSEDGRATRFYRGRTVRAVRAVSAVWCRGPVVP